MDPEQARVQALHLHYMVSYFLANGRWGGEQRKDVKALVASLLAHTAPAGKKLPSRRAA
jgi:hypothetical protein